MAYSNNPDQHLRAFNEEQWPHLVHAPFHLRGGIKARMAETKFASACQRSSISFDGNDAHIRVLEDLLFSRIAEAGWVGIEESYMAGEWVVENSDVLVDVLKALLEIGYCPKTTVKRPTVLPRHGFPLDLLKHTSEDAANNLYGHFSTGVPTTERVPVKVSRTAIRRPNEPKRYFVDVTRVDAPLEAEKQDLGRAQANSVKLLLKQARARKGATLLEFPAGGGAIPIEAAKQGIAADCFLLPHHNDTRLNEHLILAGVRDSVKLISSNRTARRYSSIVSAGCFDRLGWAEKITFLHQIEALLAPGGVFAMQTIMRNRVNSRALRKSADAALVSLHAYLWPDLSYLTADQLFSITENHSSLRVREISLAPDHLVASLRLQRHTFEAHIREAAADGYDLAYRRLWVWQLALREALARLGVLTLGQLALESKHRGGRR